MATGVTSFQWFFWGYSLTFSHSAGRFIGDLANIGFRNTLAAPSVGSHKIPDLLFAVYQGMFAAITYVYLKIRKTGREMSDANVVWIHAGWLLPLVLWLNVVVCYRALSSCLSGLPSSTMLLLAGHGTRRAGLRIWVGLTLLVVHQCISRLAQRLLHIHSCWERGGVMVHTS